MRNSPLADFSALKPHPGQRKFDSRRLLFGVNYFSRSGVLIVADHRAHGQVFSPWYNLEHHHSGIAMPTPYMVHYGLASDVLDNQQRVLTAAFHQHPERFVRKPPRPASLPAAVWINPPKPLPEGGETH
jgi:hypothetical protein